MLTDDELTQIKIMMAQLLVEHDLLRDAKRKRSRAAEKQRRYRERNKKVTHAVTRLHRANGNEKVTHPVTRTNDNTSPVVLKIPLVNHTEWGVHEDYLRELESAYPAVDGPATLREIRAWCVSNPSQCKTERGMPRFLNRWFAKVQNGS
jgi:hypothetical protein